MFGQMILHIFNLFWFHSPILKENRPFVHRYTTVPMTETIAVVEFIKNCEGISTFDWSKFDNMSSDDANGFFNSIVGAYVSCYVLAIKDRNQRNMLISSDPDPVFVLLNLEYCFNTHDNYKKSPKFAIPKKMKEEFVKRDLWVRFVSLCQEAFLILQSQALTIINLCVQLWQPVQKISDSKIRESLLKTLMVEYCPIDSIGKLEKYINLGAEKWDNFIVKKLENAPRDRIQSGNYSEFKDSFKKLKKNKLK